MCSASPSCRSSLLPVISVWTGLVGPASGGWKSFCCICLGSVLREAELVDSSVTSSFRTRSRSPSAGRPVIPFQLEVGFANLAVGILGIVAMGLRDGFRQATVIAGTVFGGGATVVHVMDVIESGNLAPGNTIQNVSNLLRPALLIAFLAASRRAERSPDSEAHTSGFDRWRGPRVRAAGLMTGSVAAGFGGGFAIDLPVIGALVGTLVGAGLAAFVVARSSGGISARRTDSANPPPA